VNTEHEGGLVAPRALGRVLDLWTNASAAKWRALSKATEQAETTRRLIFILLAIQLPVYALVIGWLIGR
jgi:hypothetical protein